jgi:peptidoglycan/xylan/chitin deacetylase (PgdA/CDA1 family)
MTRRVRVVLTVAVVTFAGVIALAWAGWRLSNSRSYQLFGELVTHVETDDSVVALTLDDGPLPVYTDSVLHILADSSVHATFFVVGATLVDNLELGRRIVQEGHELGNHSYTHHRLVFKTPGYMRHEIEGTDSLIRTVGQQGAIPFRPPYGKRLVILPWLLSRSSRITVLWDVEPDTYPGIARDPTKIVEYVVSHVRPGSIILLHTETVGRAPARAALPRLIGALRATGYQFVTVSELMRRRAPQRRAA